MSSEPHPTWLVGKPGWQYEQGKSRVQAPDRDAAALAAAQKKYAGYGAGATTHVAVTHVGGGWYDVEHEHWSGGSRTVSRDFRVARAPDQSRRGLDEDAARAALAALFAPGWAVPEIGLRAGYDSGRADLALLPDVGPSLGCEVKTARDSLDRLPRQVPLYEALFPRCLLAVTPRHLEHALALLPEAWGVAVLDPESHAVAEVRRAPVVRPGAPDPLSGAGLLSELWGEELLPLVQALGVRVTKAKRLQVGERAHLLLEHHGVAECRAIALRVLSERKGRVRAARHEQISLSSTHNPHV